MSRNGSGRYSLPSSVNPVSPGELITATWANTTLNDVAAALTDSISASGVTVPLANLPMGGFRHTGVSNPAARNQYLTLGAYQDGLAHTITLDSANGNNLTGTLLGWAATPPAGYGMGMIVSWTQPATNTTQVSLNLGSMGAKSVLNTQSLQLQAGDLVAGTTYMAFYTGVAFVMMSHVSSSNVLALQNSVTGWQRPVSGAYTSIAIVNTTDVTVPAGSGYIVAPEIAGVSALTEVNWGSSTVTLSYLATASQTTLAVDIDGNIMQIPNRPTTTQLRDVIVLGVVGHPRGTVDTVQTRPAIFSDDSYLFRDYLYTVGGRLIAGGKVTPGTTAQTVNLSESAIFLPGGTPNNADSPNIKVLPSVLELEFTPVYGPATLGADATVVDCTSYDPDGAGVLTTMAANDRTVHRLFWQAGRYYMVYGQEVYSTLANAITYIELNRSNFKQPTFLQDAVLIAELVVSYTAAPPVAFTASNSAFFSASSRQVYFGSPGALSDAPADGQTYGRKNNAWDPVLSGTAPLLPGDVTIEKQSPRLIERYLTPATPGWAGLQVQQGPATPGTAYDWFTIEVTEPDDIAYFNSYNPADGVLRHSTQYDLATGVWNFPAWPTALGTTIGNVTSSDLSVVDGAFVQYDGVTGLVVKEGPLVQQAIDDNTAGRVLINGSWGLGSTGSLLLPRGTTAQRPSLQPGELRYNTELSQYETTHDFGYLPLWLVPPDGITGFGMYTDPGQYATEFTVLPGVTNQTVSHGGDPRRGIVLAYAMTKTLLPWSAGDGGGALGDFTPATGQWLGVFVLWNDDFTCDIGIDQSWEAGNLIPYTGFQYYRRIGWIRMHPSNTTQILGFRSDADGNFELNVPLSTGGLSALQTVQNITTVAPCNVIAHVNLMAHCVGGSTLIAYCRLFNSLQLPVSPAPVASSSNYNLILRTPGTDSSAAAAQIDIETVAQGATNTGIFYMVWSLTGTGIFAYVNCGGWFDDRVAANKNNYP